MQSHATDLFQNPGLEKVYDIAAHKDVISSVEFSPDGSKVGSSLKYYTSVDTHTYRQKLINVTENDQQIRTTFEK